MAPQRGRLSAGYRWMLEISINNIKSMRYIGVLRGQTGLLANACRWDSIAAGLPRFFLLALLGLIYGCGGSGSSATPSSTAPVSTYSISGTITPVAGGAGADITLSGAASARTTADGLGNYSFTGLLNGSYTLTPGNAGFGFVPAAKSVNISGASANGVDFSAFAAVPTYTISGTVSPAAGGSGTVLTLGGGASATTVADASGNYSFMGLANGSYTVTPGKTGYGFSPANLSVQVNGANAIGQNFTAVAVVAPTYAISGTVSPASSGAGAIVILSGAASGNTAADGSGNYSFTGLANGSYSVAPSKTGYSFTPASLPVQVNGANVTGENFTATTIVATYTISGAVSPASSGYGTTLTLGGSASATTAADASGNYSFTGLAGGSYTITPSKTAYSFTPASVAVQVNGANVTGENFAATAVVAPTYAISGTVSPASGGAGTTLTLSGVASATTTADASGNYSFTGLANGSYSVAPSKTGYGFTPANLQVQVSGANVTSENFTATAVVPTYTISGTVSPSTTAAGTTLTLSGAAGGTTTVDASGNYTFIGLANGGYTITPSSPTATFVPTNLPVTIAGANVGSANFTATATGNVIFFDDFTGTVLGPAWTIISRHGEYSQNETECNVPQQVSVANSMLTIATSIGPATCGDVTTAASSWPYITGDVQWTSFNFTYGTVIVRAKLPAKSTSLWPAIWLLGSNCQVSNPLTGTTPYGACPALTAANYAEIDMVECDQNNWCQLALANYANNGSQGGSFPTCGYSVDANFHIFTLTWTARAITVAVDGTPTGCSYTNAQGWTVPSTPMFLILQTQTGGAGGTPNNAQLPATFQIDYVKVTQP